jgi:hypothetical protein|tara:strand:- start:543 stop:782 length:240 start_codon:yes stop_codon:yes gene_type:complete
MCASKIRFTFTEFGQGNAKYPWKEWSDGSKWLAKKGEDFKIKVSSFDQALRNKASTLGMKVRVNKEGKRSVIFQFYKEG